MKFLSTFLRGALLLLVIINPAFAATPEIGRMRVAIWPEYDDAGALIIYDGRFVDDGSFPIETSFLIPSGAVISDACSLSAKGQHFCQLFTQSRAGEMDEVTLKLPYPNFYLSFRITPFNAGGPKREFDYTIKTVHPISKLEVDIQRPLRAEEFSIKPATDTKDEIKGFDHYRYLFKDRNAGETFNFTIAYRKDDDRPSVNIKYSPMKGSKSWGDEASSRINEVARELACPCECPLVLEDCNMSCGLDWKDEIGDMLSKGKTKDEIIGNFIARYGDACRITPVQRIHGKFYQYTRRFDTLDWVLLWSGVIVVSAGLFMGIYFTVRKYMNGGGKMGAGS